MPSASNRRPARKDGESNRGEQPPRAAARREQDDQGDDAGELAPMPSVAFAVQPAIEPRERCPHPHDGMADPEVERLGITDRRLEQQRHERDQRRVMHPVGLELVSNFRHSGRAEGLNPEPVRLALFRTGDAHRFRVRLRRPGMTTIGSEPSKIPTAPAPRARSARRARSAPRWPTVPTRRRCSPCSGCASQRPCFEDRVGPHPGRLDLVAAHEQLLRAADHVHQQALVGVGVLALEVSAKDRLRLSSRKRMPPGPGSLIMR